MAVVAAGIRILIVHRHMDFGGQNQALALAGAGYYLAKDLFAAAAPVDVGRFDAVDAMAERAINQRSSLMFVGCAARSQCSNAWFTICERALPLALPIGGAARPQTPCN